MPIDLRNESICRVCARGKPSARETDPIIGLSQKRIFFNLVGSFSAIPVDFSVAGSELPSQSVRKATRMAQTNNLKQNGPPDPSHYAESSARENLVEHVFLGELLRGLWRRNVRDLEVCGLRSIAAGTLNPHQPIRRQVAASKINQCIEE